MDSYYDGLIRQVKELMDDSRHAEAFDLLKEELSMPYIPKVYEEEIITLYNACRSELKLQNNSTRRTADDIDALLKGSVDEQFQAVEQLKSSNIRNHLTEVQDALDSDANEWVKVFLIEALCEQNVSEEFFMERDGLRYAFVPCSLTLPRDSEVIYECVSQLRAWFENEDPSFLSLCVETLMQEAYFEKKIGEVAQRISQKDRKLVLIAGPSSSGKTTTANRLAIQLRAYGLEPHIISVDNYFLGLEERPVDESGKPDFESISALDIELFNSDMLKLLNGESVELPTYNFVTGEREYKGNVIRLGEDDILIIEGIHCLNDRLTEKLPADSKYRIYISALTQLNIDEHNRIPTTDMRLLRRMIRDNRTRGYSAAQTISRWPDVRKGEEENIFPYQDRADVVINTAMIYELAVIKSYAEPLLFGIRQDAPEYIEAKRLLKFLDYVLPLSSETVPGTSIVREFIGGSLLDVG